MAVPEYDVTGDGLGAPAVDGYSITPNDSTVLSPTPRALLIGVAGNVKVTTARGTVLTLPLPAGYNPIRVSKVWSTDTTATGIFGLF